MQGLDGFFCLTGKYRIHLPFQTAFILSLPSDPRPRSPCLWAFLLLSVFTGTGTSSSLCIFNRTLFCSTSRIANLFVFPCYAASVPGLQMVNSASSPSQIHTFLDQVVRELLSLCSINKPVSMRAFVDGLDYSLLNICDPLLRNECATITTFRRPAFQEVPVFLLTAQRPRTHSACGDVLSAKSTH